MPSERAMERARETLLGACLCEMVSPEIDACTYCEDIEDIAAALDAARAEGEESAAGLQYGYTADEVEQAKASARAEEREAWVALLKGGQWQRRDGRTYLAVRVADGADLSCPATREDAILAAIRARQPKPGSGDPDNPKAEGGPTS